MAGKAPIQAPDDLSGAYRAVWRWHFYAGVFVMPVLMLLALTGGLYLFKDEIDAALYRDMIRVPAVQAQAAPTTWVAAAQAAGGGRVANLVMPARAGQAVRLRVDRPDGVQKTVFVDPHTGRVTGVIPAGGFMELVKKTHSLTLLGRPFNILVEIVAGWTIILFATGLYLWWPRGRGRSDRLNPVNRHSTPPLLARPARPDGLLRRRCRAVPGGHRHALVGLLGRHGDGRRQVQRSGPPPGACRRGLAKGRTS